MKMIIDSLLISCDARFKNERHGKACRNCNYSNHCPNDYDECESCLELAHFPNRVPEGVPPRKYDCTHMADFYVCKYACKYIVLSSQLAEIARNYGLAIDTCAEEIDLQQFGIDHARCIDERLLGRLLGCSLDIDKDKNQRLERGCITSIDIGMYNTCLNRCRYCYANYSRNTVDGILLGIFLTRRSFPVKLGKTI